MWSKAGSHRLRAELGGEQSRKSSHFRKNVSKENCGVTGRPETMCPRSNVLGPLVPKLIVPCNTMSLELYIPVIMHYIICLGWCKMTWMYTCRDIVFLGRFI